MKWLFVTADPWPMHHGTALRVFHLARELTAIGDRVAVLTDWRGEGAREAYEAEGVNYEEVPQSEEVGLAKGIPYSVNSHFEPRLRQCAGDYDVVVLFAAEMLQYVSFCRNCPNVLADMIDDPVLAAWRRLKKASSLRWGLRNMRLLWDLRRYEKRYLVNVDLFTFVTPEDAHSFNRRNSSIRTQSVANGVSLSTWDSSDGLSGEPYFVFVGNYAFVPNRTAAEFLARKVAPLVWKKCSDVRFRFVGGNPPDWLANHKDCRIETTGFVDDVRPHVIGARGVVIPMVTGTGIKNKLLEAWAARKPVVATPLACQGIPAVDGKNLLLGSTEYELAEAIVRVWESESLAASLSSCGRTVAEREFSWSSMVARLRSLSSRDASLRERGGNAS